MKKLVLFILSFFLYFTLFAQYPQDDNNWGVVFEDSTFNSVRWTKANNHVHNKEPQVYIQNNVYINNGELVLQTKKENYTCPKGTGGCLGCNNTGTHKYTSGQVSSNNFYKYGYFEIYAKLPVSTGYWPAFWLWNEYADSQTSDCWYNEIDIFEAYGYNTDTVESHALWKFSCPLNDDKSPLGVSKHYSDYSSDYHWYGLEWNGDKITWFIDREIVREEKNIMGGIGIHHPMKIIINSALAPDWQTKNLIDTNNTIFPNYMYIQQCNVYQLMCDDTTVVIDIPNYNTFNYGIKQSISLSSVSSLPSGQNVSLRATDFIELKNGFEVPLGAELYLDINTCE